MAWSEYTESSNVWVDVNYALYVLPDYWLDGYTEDFSEAWTTQTESSNTWTVIG